MSTDSAARIAIEEWDYPTQRMSDEEVQRRYRDRLVVVVAEMNDIPPKEDDGKASS